MVRNARTDTDAMESPAFDQASKRTTLHLDAFRADSVRDRPIVKRALSPRKRGRPQEESRLWDQIRGRSLRVGPT
jgi:hypothetical protein